jgi:conjugative relaxase-like TrwC/TraI family protein
MITAVAHGNAARAGGYFEEHLSQDEYYAQGEIRPGQWIGQGVTQLGLQESAPVERAAFMALCENRHPREDTQLTLRQNAEGQRRIYYDFTCSAPKSVSILAVTLGDERLVQAHEEASRVAFRELQSEAATRVRKKGRQENRTTGTLVAAQFTHTASRALDPQLHTHFTVFNATYDASEGCWKALQSGPLYEAIGYATAVYRNHLARSVEAMGYRIEPAPHGWQIQGVSTELQRRFSKRSAQRDEVVRTMEARLGRSLTPDEVSLAVHHGWEWNRWSPGHAQPGALEGTQALSRGKTVRKLSGKSRSDGFP